MEPLKALGFTQEELQESVIGKIVDRLMEGKLVVDDGEEFWSESPFSRHLNKRIKDHIDATVDALAEKHVLPNVTAMVENVTLQKTNQWGEAKDERITFIEYLIQRAEVYLTEKVNFEGKSKKEDRYGSFTGTQTRITHMVERHLHYSIERAMKQAMEAANSVIVGGIEETVKLKLAEVSDKLKVELKTK